MRIYNAKKEITCDRKIVVDDMILTTDMPTTAGSKMLDGYVSLFEAEVLTRAGNAGYGVIGKTSVGEFAIDLVGETAVFSKAQRQKRLSQATLFVRSRWT